MPGCVAILRRGIGDVPAPEPTPEERTEVKKLARELLGQSLREDQEDLAAVRARARERTLGYEEFLAKLRADGAIGAARQGFGSDGPARHPEGRCPTHPRTHRSTARRSSRDRLREARRQQGASPRALVSGDRGLLALTGTPGLCAVLGVDAFSRQFLGD